MQQSCHIQNHNNSKTNRKKKTTANKNNCTEKFAHIVLTKILFKFKISASARVIDVRHAIFFLAKYVTNQRFVFCFCLFNTVQALTLQLRVFKSSSCWRPKSLMDSGVLCMEESQQKDGPIYRGHGKQHPLSRARWNNGNDVGGLGTPVREKCKFFPKCPRL